MADKSTTTGSGEGVTTSRWCYNCGSPDHYMDACQEATRAEPHGVVLAKAKDEALRKFQNKAQHNPSQYQQNSWHRPGQDPRRHQGAVVTKYPASKAPVVTRFAPPSNHQSQKFGTYPTPNPTPNPPAYHQQPTHVPHAHGQYSQNGYSASPPPPPPPAYLQQPTHVPHGNGQYNQNGYSAPPPPPPPPDTYNQYGQPGYPPPQPPPQSNYVQPPYPPQQPQYNQQAPQQQTQYSGQYPAQQPSYTHPQPAPQSHTQPQQPPYNQQAPHQQSQYPAPPQNYQTGQQHGYPVPQGHQGNPWNQQPSSVYQQSALPPHQQPFTGNYNQQHEQPSYQPPQWGQPAHGPNAPQQNGQYYNGAEQPYYSQDQSHYPQHGNYNHGSMPCQQGLPQIAPPVDQYQQYGQAQGYQQYDQAQGYQQYDQTEYPHATQSQYPSGTQHHYPGSHQNQTPDSQYVTYPGNNDQSSYPQSNGGPSPAYQSRPGSTVPQGGSQHIPPPVGPQLSDKEETEWILEKHLTLGLKTGEAGKSIADLTTDEYYALLSEKDTKSCDPIGKPLPDKFSEDLILPPVYGATGVGSKFIDTKADFIKSIRDQPQSASFALDPLFLDADERTWHSKSSGWVDERQRVALGLQNASQDASLDASVGPKSLKRSASSREEGLAQVRGGVVQPNSCSEDGSHKKRTKFNDSNHMQSNPETSRSMPASARVAKSNSPPPLNPESTPDGEFHNGIAGSSAGVPPAFSRETTPAFDLGEGVAEGEKDPWAVEPGEGSLQVHNRGGLNKTSSMSPPPVPGRQYGKPFIPQNQYYNKPYARHQDSNRSGANNQSGSRRDSGYASALGSRTSSSHTINNGHDYAVQSDAARYIPHQNGYGQRPYRVYNQGDTRRQSTPMSSDSDHLRPGDSPLTPTSAELLGHNIATPPDQGKGYVKPKIKRTPKRKQPVVETAYSRRW